MFGIVLKFHSQTTSVEGVITIPVIILKQHAACCFIGLTMNYLLIINMLLHSSSSCCCGALLTRSCMCVVDLFTLYRWFSKWSNGHGQSTDGAGAKRGTSCNC